MKLLHTSINVRDMDRSIKFYEMNFGMKLSSRREIQENNAEIAFLRGEGTEHSLELTWWKSKSDYIEGDQLDHIAFGTTDIMGDMARMRARGVEIAREPFPMGDHRIAFVKDPNGIWIELIEQK